MTALEWDLVGERQYETGVDRGVLYHPDGAGLYNDGFAWNGLTTVTETPSGAEANAQYADNIKYLNLYSAEEFGGTIEAFTFPDEFALNDGTEQPSPGISVGQQRRRPFGLCYRTKVGNDVDGDDHGYKLHLVYGATASPSEKAYATVNDSPEALAFSWEFATVPVAWSGGKPTSLIVVDSTEVDPADLAALEAELYGDAGSDPRLPLPDEVVTLLGGAATVVDMNLAANQPAFNNGTGVVTLPATAGVQWVFNGDEVAAGAQAPIAIGDVAEIDATPTAGNVLEGDTNWAYERV